MSQSPDQNYKNDVKLAGVVGWPIAQSLSPMIHGEWAARAGLCAHYIPLAISNTYDDFARAMDGLQAVGFRGVNVTLPHKEHALKYAAAASDVAKAAGAANMLTFGDDGPYADNSDALGFANAVREVSGKPGQHALVLGAGGAARGIILALKSLGVAQIEIANRTRAKAEAVAAAVGGDVLDWSARASAAGGADIIVNTTSLGMAGQPPLEMSLDGVKSTTLVADIVYTPLKTPLLQAAERLGNATVDGLAMLMHQATPGFRAWFGGEPQVDDALRQKLVRELERRGKV